MKTPRQLNTPGNENSHDDQNLPQKSFDNSSDQGTDTNDSDTEPIELTRDNNNGFFSRIDTSFPLSGGETEDDLKNVLHRADDDDEFKREPKDTIDLSDTEQRIDDEDYLLNDGE